MKAHTFKHSFEVKGLEFDSNPFSSATLAGFDSITINETLTLTFEEFRELPLSFAQEIWNALDNLANQACDEWRETSRDLRLWFNRQ